MRVWTIATQSPDYAAQDLSGAGAKITGGRWNRHGLAVLYCADKASLACLETLFHLGAGGLPLQRYLIAIDIPDAVWKVRETHTAQTFPSKRNVCPVSQASTDFGDLIRAHAKITLTALLRFASDRGASRR